MGNPNRRGDFRPAQSNVRDSDDPATRTTFFITNISDRVTGLKLKEAFRPFVTVTDAWVLRRRSAKGNVFGFVRCQKLRDPFEVLPALNEITIMDTRISVSLALFDRAHKRINYGEEEPVTKVWVPREKNVVQEDFPTINAVYGSSSGSKKVLQLDDTGAMYPLHSIGRAIVGTSDSIARLHAIKKMVHEAGFMNAAVSYIGGLSVVITFHDEEEMHSFVSEKELVWKEVLTTVTPWTGQAIPFERIAVLKVVGMPVCVRENVVFDKVGRLFGDVVWPSDFSWDGDDNAIGFTHVLTKMTSRIDEEVTIVWQNKSFTIWVVEENSAWVPEFESVDVAVHDDDMEEGEIRDHLSGGSDEAPVDGGESNGRAENQAASSESIQGGVDFPVTEVGNISEKIAILAFDPSVLRK